MTADTPNAFVQTPIEKLDMEDHAMMKIAGVLVDLLVEDGLKMCAEHVACKGGTKVLHVEALRAIHGMLISTLSFHLKLKEDLEVIGFEFKPCDACVRKIHG